MTLAICYFNLIIEQARRFFYASAIPFSFFPAPVFPIVGVKCPRLSLSFPVFFCFFRDAIPRKFLRRGDQVDCVHYLPDSGYDTPAFRSFFFIFVSLSSFPQTCFKRPQIGTNVRRTRAARSEM